ncbi:MAG: sialidase family protein [Gemmatimonadota bacterium]
MYALALAGAALSACTAPAADAADDGITLAPIETASVPTGVGAAPVVALDSAGRRAIAWVSAPDSGSDGHLHVSVDGRPPTEIRDALGAIEAHGEAPPKLVYERSGTLHALYVVAKVVPGRRFPTSALRHISSRDGGRTWTPPASVTDAAVFGSYNFHALHVSAEGVLYASWLDGRDGKSATYLTRSTDGGATWEANRRVAPGEACPCCRTAIATATGGIVYIAWRTVMPGNIRDIVVARSSDGGVTFAPPVRVHADDWVFEACPHAGPSMATDPDGRLHVTWWTGKDGNAGVFYAQSTDGATTFARPVALGVAAFSRASHVQLALGDSGRIAAVWDDGTLTSPEIVLRVSRDNGTSFGAPARLSDEGRAATYPMLVWSGSALTVAWSEKSTEVAEHAAHNMPDHRDKNAVMGLPRVGASQVMLRSVSVR